MKLVSVPVHTLLFIIHECPKCIVGGRTSARRKGPTRTIPGNQAIEQEANAYINIKQE